MKKRLGFVSNSSSSSFIIMNKSQKDKTLIDFVKENTYLIDDFNSSYGYNYKHKEIIECAERISSTYGIFEPKTPKECVFGDEQGTILGQIYDYILRNGGSSKNFTWKFNKYYR
jgi:hypothetical protein